MVAGKAPYMIRPAARGPGEWSSGLCDCFADAEACCTSEMVQYAHAQQVIAGDKFFSPGCFFLYLFAYVPETTLLAAAFGACFCWGPQRKAVREKFGLKPDPWGDCCCTFWCHACTMCQTQRELKARGIFTHAQWIGAAPPTDMGVYMSAPAQDAAPEGKL